MKHVLSFGLAMAALSATVSPARALTKLEITDRTARETVPEIIVPGGHSVLLSFNNDRYIQSILIDDPSILGVATDRTLCGGQSASSGCGFATAMRLTQLSGGIDLPGASFSSGGGLATIVSVVTTDRTGGDSEIYQFLVNTTGTVTSDISMVSIVPSSGSTNRQPTDSLLENTRRNDFDLPKIESGQRSAIQQGIADTNSEAWQALEQFLELTDKGQSVSDAIAESGVPTALLGELERMGSVAQI